MYGSGTYESALRASGYQDRSPSRSFGSSYGIDVRRSEESIHQNSRQNDETPSVKLSEVVRMITEEAMEGVKGKVSAAQVTDEASLTTQNAALYLQQWTTEEKLSQAEFVRDLSDKVTQASVMFMNAQSTPVGRSRMIDYIITAREPLPCLGGGRYLYLWIDKYSLCLGGAIATGQKNPVRMVDKADYLMYRQNGKKMVKLIADQGVNSQAMYQVGTGEEVF